MKKLIDELMYGYEIRPELAEIIVNEKEEIKEEERNNESCDDECDLNHIEEIKKSLKDIRKKYEPFSLDEEYEITTLEDRIEVLERELETERDWKECGSDSYSFYGVSPHDFY